MPLDTAGFEVVAGAEEVVLVVEDWVEGAWEETWRFDGILGGEWRGLVEESGILCRRDLGEVYGGDWVWKNGPRETRFDGVG